MYSIPLCQLLHLHVALNALQVIIFDALHDGIGQGLHPHRLVNERNAEGRRDVEDGDGRKDIVLGPAGNLEVRYNRRHDMLYICML